MALNQVTAKMPKVVQIEHVASARLGTWTRRGKYQNGSSTTS